MKKSLFVLSLVAVLISGVVYVYAQDPGSVPGHRGMPPGEHWGAGKWSSLTPEQKTKFQELRQKFNEETAQLRGSMLTKRLELQSLWSNPKADSKAILDKERELRALQDQMKDKVVQYRLEARKFLTPEQITEFGQGWGMGHGFGGAHMMGRGHMMGQRQGMRPGYGPCQ